MNQNPLGGSQAKGENKLAGSQAKSEGNVNQEMKERVISERVVSERVLGSANPVARFGRNAGEQISSRLGGVVWGMLLIIIALVVVWQSENLTKSSLVVKNLPLLAVDQAFGQSGLVKVSGKVTSAPIKYSGSEDNLLYYRHTKDVLEMVKDTETETRVVNINGQDVEQTIEKEVERPEWVNKIDEEKWAPIVLDNKITIRPENAGQELNLSKIVSSEDDKSRELVEGLFADDNLLVIGEINNNQISGGETFIISNKSDSALTGALEDSENTTWWLYKIATALLFGFGLYLLLGPLLLILDIIPFLGDFAKGAILVAALIVGVILTIFSSAIINYWYIFVIILIGIAVYAVSARKNKTANVSS